MGSALFSVGKKRYYACFDGALTLKQSHCICIDINFLPFACKHFIGAGDKAMLHRPLLVNGKNDTFGSNFVTEFKRCVLPIYRRGTSTWLLCL